MSSGVKKTNTNSTKGSNPLTGFWHRTAGIFGDPQRAKPLMWFALVAAIVTVLSFIYLFYSVPRSNTLIKDVGELRVLSQQVAKNSSEATIGGSEQAFSNLQLSQQQFNDRLDNVIRLQGASSQLDTVELSWLGINEKINNILSNRQAVNELYDFGRSISDVMPEVQSEYNAVVDGMVRSGAPSSQVVMAKNQVVLSERIMRSINAVLIGEEGSVATAADFQTDAESFGRILNAQLNGDARLGVLRINDPSLRASLTAVKKVYDEVIQVTASRILVRSPQISLVRESSSRLLTESEVLLDQLTLLSEEVSSSLRNIIPGLLMLAGLVALGYSFWRLFSMRSQIDQQRAIQESQRQRREAEMEADRARKIQDESERNQTAILRLLDELGDLADGDLTVNATVSEDFTGAIADSVNFAIDQLRLLVSAINNTALRVAESSQDTQTTAMQLAEASEHQAQEIAGASAAVNEMAVSIDQVSANAMESAAVADRSVAIAYNGAEVVQRSIEGMDTIREQIQETAKRIKRLGESSQEIGDIVSLINDIADQTNILALNAAIQASMAGEAGRGFAVVADEVQRLAERSAAATKQIEGLVKTIQTDTNEAVISMEQTTSEVVRGAHLAKDAGVALGEIQSVSRSLADLIQNISNAARQQAASAGHISNTMNIIQEITTQTTAGTIATARSVGNLAEMAVELRESVSGFKLPEEEHMD
ncbi:MAG: methyl-accepting chemotaxis protein [Pseudomonadota bacterium]|nr:methyl-accepting chemotaxis protein [Pseudomonadota bacterium]